MDEKKKLILLAVLGFLAAASLIYGMLAPPRRSQTNIDKVFRTESLDKGPLKEFNRLSRAAVRTSYEKYGRNPFTLGIKKLDEPLVLNGILWDSVMPRAIVNNTIVEKGDTVEGLTVRKITREAVILNDNDSDFELRLR